MQLSNEVLLESFIISDLDATLVMEQARMKRIMWKIIWSNCQFGNHCSSHRVIVVAGDDGCVTQEGTREVAAAHTVGGKGW